MSSQQKQVFEFEPDHRARFASLTDEERRALSPTERELFYRTFRRSHSVGIYDPLLVIKPPADPADLIAEALQARTRRRETGIRHVTPQF